jgi:hypothetical protein
LGPFGGAQMSQNSIKKHFYVVLDHFFYKNGSIDFVRALFTSRPLAGLCLPFWVHLGVPKCPKIAHKKHYFLVVLDHFSHKKGHIDLVGGIFRTKVLDHTSRPLAGLCLPFSGSWEGV